MANSIKKIEAFTIRIPLGRPLKLGAMEISDREYAVVRVHDDEGNFGTSFGLTRNAPIAAVVERNIRPHWLNKSLEEHEIHYQTTVKANICLGTNGIFYRALSLLDCALYDLLAIRANLPLYQYLGGQAKPMQTILVGGYPSPDENEASLAEEMALFQKYNPAGVKIASTTDAKKDGERLALCRKYLPESIPLMIDCVWAQTDAHAFAKEVNTWESLNVSWVEDPFLTDDYESMRYLSEHTHIALAVGDEQSGYLNMLRLMDQGKVGVLRLDATVCGGVRSFIKMAEAAYERGIPVACHVFHQLHLHLACALPGIGAIEYFLPESDIESYQHVWDSDLPLVNGHFAPTKNPGVGTLWNEEALDHYKIPTVHAYKY